MTKKELDDAARRLAETGLFGDITPFHASNTASGSAFLTATDKAGCRRFLKLYPARTLDSCRAEAGNAEAFRAALDPLRCRAAKVSAVNEILPVGDAYLAHVQEFCPGETLDEAVIRRRRFSPQESDVLRAAFADFARLFRSIPYCHRDVCPKNFIFTGDGLVLVDFLTTIPKKNPVVVNPSKRDLSFIFSLGAGFNPERGLWNDAYSLLLTYKAVEPLLAPDAPAAARLVEILRAASDATPTLRPEYVVDEDWKRKMRPVYLKLLLRPLWTSKKASREKRRAIRAAIAALLKRPTGRR